MALNMAGENSKPAKRLSDLLLERQEPFVLKVYLSERGCLEKSGLKRSASTRGVARYAKVLRTIRKMLVSINGRLTVKNSDKTEAKFTDGDRFSSSSSTTVYNSCSESDPEDAITYSLQKDDSFTLVIEDALNSFSISGEERRGFVEDSKNLSPVSVLEKTTPCHGASSNSSRLRYKQHENLTKTSTSGAGRATEDLILSASLQNLLVQSPAEEAQDQCLKSKTRTKQLLLDFMQEMVAIQENKTMKQQQQQQMLGTEELGKFICEKIKACGKESSITQRVNCDIFSSKRDIGGYEQMKGEIGIEIADAIFKEMSHEIVIDMFSIY